MGFIIDMIKNFKEKQKEREEIDDDKTTDYYLRSLRRQRRTQLEQLEKEQLIKDIKEFEKQRTKEAVLGVPLGKDDNFIKRKLLKKKINILKAKQFTIEKKPKNNMFSRGFL